MPIDLMLDHMPAPPAGKDFAIGVIGSGFIIRDIQLVAYRDAGYKVVAIASAEPASARAVAELRGVPSVHATYQELIADPRVEILDIAVPPSLQLGIVREAVRRRGHIKGILAQKPLATNYKEAHEIVRLCREAGITLAVNQNMRYDQSIRALKTLLVRGDLGEPVLATIEMRAVPHWQSWLAEYERLTLLNMSIHHLDCFRYLFGDPEGVFASVRQDPRTTFRHRDGICLYILEYAGGLRASGWDDVWSGPDDPAADRWIHWRVEGTEGLAHGTIGWPAYPSRQPSTIDFMTRRQPGTIFAPRWKEVWFPDAFSGTMGDLLDAVARGADPATSGDENLGTMALIEACYRSFEERRFVSIDEIRSGGN